MATIERDGRRYTIAPRMDGPKIHDLKCDAGYFEAVSLGHKTAELRLNDRDFAPLDIVRLHELEYGALTGAVLERQITHIVWDTNGPWLAHGYCMLSLGPSPRVCSDCGGPEADHQSNYYCPEFRVVMSSKREEWGHGPDSRQAGA